MSIEKQLQLLQTMHRAIKFKRSGGPNAFAAKLGISRSLMFRILGEMKKLGAPIQFCTRRECYVYAHHVEFKLGFYEPETAAGRADREEEAVVRELTKNYHAA